jgi:methionyl-tRNA formyltransferase
MRSDGLERGQALTATPQSASEGAYYSFPTDDDLIRFTGQGWRLFDREDVLELLESYGCGPTRTQS